MYKLSIRAENKILHPLSVTEQTINGLKSAPFAFASLFLLIYHSRQVSNLNIFKLHTDPT